MLRKYYCLKNGGQQSADLNCILPQEKDQNNQIYFLYTVKDDQIGLCDQ